MAIAGDRPRSPAPALVRTALTRVEEQTGTEPYLAGIPTQLVDLGLPFAYAEQGRLLASSIAAVTLTTEERGEPALPVGRPGDAALDRPARRHGPCDRGPRRLDRRERRRCVPHAGQRLPARPRRERLGSAPDAPGRRGAVRAGSARPARPNAPAPAPARAGCARAPYPDPVLALRGPPPLARRRRRDPPDRCRASAPDLRVRRDRLAGRRARPRRHRARHRVASASPAPDVCGTGNGRGAPRRLLDRARLARGRRVRHRGREAVRARLRAPVPVRLALASASHTVLGTRGALRGRSPRAARWSRHPLVTARPRARGHRRSTSSGSRPSATSRSASVLLALAWAAAAGQLGALAFGRYAPYAGGAEPPPAGLVRNAIGSLFVRSRPGYARTR